MIQNDELQFGDNEQTVLEQLNVVSTNLPDKEELLNAARNCRNTHGESVWTPKVASQLGYILKNAYVQPQDLEAQDAASGGVHVKAKHNSHYGLMNRESVDELAYEIFLRDKHQFRVDLHGMVRSTSGWCCLFALCHAPWIAISLYLLSTEKQDVCETGQLSAYLWGFAMLLLIVVVINLCLSLCRSCEGVQYLGMQRRTAAFIASFNALVIIVYNIWGLLLVWNPVDDGFQNSAENGTMIDSTEYTGWRKGTSPEQCPSLHALATGTMIMFGILPACCVVLQRLTVIPGRGKKRKEVK